MRYLIGLLLLIGATVSQAATPWVTGFWSAGNSRESIANIPWSNITHLNYFAAGLNSNGTVGAGYTSQPELANLVTAAHAHGVKVLICLADGTGLNFEPAVGPSLINTTVSNIASYVNTNNFDGVDYDWENSPVTADFEALISKTRAALPAKLILADVVNGNPGSVHEIVMGNQFSNLDQINVMCYDQGPLYVNGPSNPRPWYNDAILNGSVGATFGGTCQWRTTAFQSHGVPASKLGVGIPFYGKRWTGATAVNTPPGNTSTITATFFYGDLVNDSTRYIPANQFYDSTYKSNYLSIPGLNEFDSYNGTQSMQDAVAWGKSSGFGGYMMFTLEYEYNSSQTGTARYPLSNALSAAAAGTLVCNNNSGDPAALQTALNAGGALTVSGTCNLGTSQITVNAPVAVTGGTFAASSTFTNWTFTVNSDNVTWNGSTFVNAGVLLSGGNSTKRTNDSFTGCTFRDYTTDPTSGPKQAPLYMQAIWKDSFFTGNTVSNVWTLGFPNSTWTSQGNESHMMPGLYNEGGLDNTKIENNTFTQIGHNAIKIFSNGLSSPTTGYIASGVSISYNRFTYIHRIGVEFQNCTSPGSTCNGFAIAYTGLKVAGNFLSHPAFAMLDTYAYSLPIVGNSNSLYINNTMVGNFASGNTTAPIARLGLGIEMPNGTACCNGPIAGIGGGFNRGNVISGENNPAGGGTPGWFNAFTNYHGPANQPIAASTYTFDDNIMCGPSANGVVSNAGDGKTVDQHNFKGACASGSALFTSAMAYTWTSANNQTFPSGGGSGTWSLWVTDPLSIRWVDFYIDGSSTSANHQEIVDDSATFGSDQRWVYHYTFNTSSLSTGTHTILAKITDASGTVLTTSSQSFSNSTGGLPAVAFSPSAVTFATPVFLGWSSTSPQTVTVTNTGTGTLTISGITLTGANPGDFSQTNNCGTSLNPSSTCTISITFTPTALGTRTASVSMADNAAGSPHTATITGTAAAATTISVNATVVQPGVKPFGINLGGQTFTDSRQLTKNLTNLNVGFNPTVYQSVVSCSTGSTSACTPSNGNWGGAGFWPSGTPISVISGAASGCSTTANWNGTSFSFITPCSGAVGAGDYIIVGPQSFSGTSQLIANNQNWVTQTNSGTVTAESSDLPASIDSTQAAQLDAPGGSDVAAMQFQFDNTAGRSFVRLKGTYNITFWAKGISGAQQALVSFDRSGTSYLAPATVTLTGSWAQYSVPFTASETATFPCSPGTGACPAEVVISTTGADTFYLDGVQVQQCSTLTTGGCVADANTTIFRDEVVSTLQTLKPGVVRMWTGTNLTSTLDNLIADTYGRQPANFSSHQTVYNANWDGYSLYDFLGLVQYLNTHGAPTEAWVVVPITFSTADASNLIDYLSAGSTTIYGSKRIAQGQTTPWTAVIPKIHLEFGQEAWNIALDGGNIINATTYATRADAIFTAMKANTNFATAKMDLVLGGQWSNPANAQIEQNIATHNDSIAVAPMMMVSPTDATSTNHIWTPALAEPQAFYGFTSTTNSGIAAEGCATATITGPTGAGSYFGGCSGLGLIAAQYSTHPKPVNVYATNFGTQFGTFSQSSLDSFASAWGEGLSVVENELIGLQNGVLTQNLFQLGQWEKPANSGTAFLFGSVVDMGGSTNLQRPSFLAEQVANAAIPYNGSMLQTVQSNAPTSSVSNINTVSMPTTQLVQSYAFNSGVSYSLVLLNTDIVNPQVVVFRGANAPPNGATVTKTVLLSANLSDTNETAAVIAPVTTTVSNFNPASGFTLAPFSETILTWTVSAGTPVATFSPTSQYLGSTVKNTTSPSRNVTLTNTGTGPLSISNITISGTNSTNFTQSNTCGTTLGASLSCTIMATMTPTATGNRTAAISVTDSAAGSPHTVALSGIGTQTVCAGVITNWENCAFDAGTSKWLFSGVSFATFTSDSNAPGSLPEGIVTVTSSPTNNIEVYQEGFSLVAGQQYTFTVKARTTRAQALNVFGLQDISPFNGYGLSCSPSLTTSFAIYTCTFVSTVTASNARFTIQHPQAASGDQFFYQYITVAPGGPPGVPTLAPATASVAEGQSVVLTGSTPGSWCVTASSVGVLSVGGSPAPVCPSQSGSNSTATYTAPASVIAQHAINGCMVAPNDSVFSARVDTLPVASGLGSIIVTAPGSGYVTPPTVTISGCSVAPQVKATISSAGGVNGFIVTTLGTSCSSPTAAFSGGGGTGATAAVTSATTWPSNVSSVPLSFQPGWTANTITNATPAVNVAFAYTPQYNTSSTYVWQVPPPPYYQENGVYPKTPAGQDFHSLFANRQTCVWEELYKYGMLRNDFPNSNTTSGLQFSSTSYTVPTGGTNAAGVSISAPLVQAEEVESGSINHALFFTTAAGFIHTGFYLWPASQFNGSTNTGAAPMGTRYRLKASFAPTGLAGVSITNTGTGYGSAPTVTVAGCTGATVTATVSAGSLQTLVITAPGTNCTSPTLSFSGGGGSGAAGSALPYSTEARTLLVALQRYGMFLTDIGTGNSVSVAGDLTQHPAVAAAVAQLNFANIPFGSNFEAIDESSLMESPSSLAVAPAATNGQGVEVQFTAGTTTIPLHVALQPVAVGTPAQFYSILAGEAPYQFSSWVTGTSANQTVNWTISSCSAGAGNCGSISSAGLYTPPGTVTAGTTLFASLAATSVADTNAVNHVYLTVYPTGSPVLDTLFIDSGGAALDPYTDTLSNVWMADQSSYAPTNGILDDTYDPNGYWNPVVDKTLYQTTKYTYGNDILYGTFILPNGNYKVGLLFSQPSCLGSYNQFVYGQGPGGIGWSDGPVNLVAQGQVARLNYDPGLANGDPCRAQLNDSTGTTVYIPAPVTNRTLDLGVYSTVTVADIYLQSSAGRYIPGNLGLLTHPWIAGVSVQPDATAPHWTVDLQQTSILQIGSVTTAPIATSGFTLSVTNPALFRRINYVQIDSELMWICGIDTVAKTLTVCDGGRGYGGTTVASHLTGAVVSPAVQFNVENWYEAPLAPDPVWSLVSGPGTITSTGLYIAPSSINATQPVVVSACSASNPGVCDTEKFWAQGATGFQVAIH